MGVGHLLGPLEAVMRGSGKMGFFTEKEGYHLLMGPNW